VVVKSGLTVSRIILIVSKSLDCLNLFKESQCKSQHDLVSTGKVSILKNLDQEKKILVLTLDNLDTLKKVDLNTEDIIDLNLDCSRLSRPPSLIFLLDISNQGIKWFLTFNQSQKLKKKLEY
jgi:hypothetical protein